MTIYEQIVLKIIQRQELVIGRTAWSEAKKIPGIKIGDSNEVSLEGDGKDIVDLLIQQYEKLFGVIADQVCKEAVQDLVAEIPSDQVPSKLQ